MIFLGRTSQFFTYWKFSPISSPDSQAAWSKPRSQGAVLIGLRKRKSGKSPAATIVCPELAGGINTWPNAVLTFNQIVCLGFLWILINVDEKCLHKFLQFKKKLNHDLRGILRYFITNIKTQIDASPGSSFSFGTGTYFLTTQKIIDHFIFFKLMKS